MRRLQTFPIRPFIRSAAPLASRGGASLKALSLGLSVFLGLSACAVTSGEADEDAEDGDDSMFWEDPDFGTGGGDGDGDGLFTGGSSAAGGASSGGVGSGGTFSGSGGVSSSGGQSASGGESGDGGSDSTGSGGTGSGGSPASCTTSAPPSQYVQTLNATWQEMTGQLAGQGAGARPAQASILNFRNSILDQIFETNGTLNFCVRYESTVTLSATNRDKLVAALERNLNEWIDQIEDYDCFPYDHVPVKVVGWAAMSRATFGWQDGEHPGLMYIGDDSFESAPQCAQACGRFFHRQAGYQYPDCQGGRANHYDMSLWLTEGMSGGAGGDWGQRVGRGYFIGAIDQTTLHILSHEMGHGFGFPDYYNWSTWVPGVPAPHSIMVAGAASSVTQWDTWMMRRLWSEMKENRAW